ncbi:MAG: hypothetical protein DRJ66_06040 [Thermoprotei archaeon]|nr:MAG: hypothetical protein DRJ66_06040 [Thermoprotei archaeon]RLF18397.1 MAG: hypothetical protein DRZ82_08250 [Thermoprotei archaeon]
MITRVFAILFATLMSITTLCGVIYGHWIKELRIHAQVETGDLNVNIRCYKVCALCAKVYSGSDGSCIRIDLTGSRCWMLFIKVLIINNGTMPVRMNYKSDLPVGINCKTHFIGPFKLNELSDILSIIKDCKIHDDIPDLDVGEAVLACHVISPNDDIKEGIANGIVTYEARFNSWVKTLCIELSFNITSSHCDN